MNNLKLCEICGIRKANVSFEQSVNGRQASYALCEICANRGVPEREEVNVFDYLSDKGREVIEKSFQKAAECGVLKVDTEHLAFGILATDDVIVSRMLETAKVTREDASSYINENLQKYNRVVKEEEMGVSPKFKNVMLISFRIAQELRSSYIGPEHLLLGALVEKEGLGYILLSRLGLKYDDGQKTVRERSATNGAETEKSATPTLDKYGVDLLKRAKEGKIDPVEGLLKRL